jgi:DNA helicase II / ATP-dependent DNA helicase PcrA
VSPDKTNIILGPPGTGKTTYLLSELDTVFKKYPPESVCFITFTKKAANEALERAMDKFDLSEEELPMFSTMHSLAFRQLHLKRNNVMNVRDYYEIASQAGVGISFETFDSYGRPQGYQKGNGLLNVVSYSKIKKVSLKNAWEAVGVDLMMEEVEDFKQIIDQYKVKFDKVDFDDMIIAFTERAIAPFVQVMFIDEAQDLSTIQWDMANFLSTRTQENYIAGDDDQSIFEWAGADVDQFIKLQGRVRVLDKSWRVPKAVKSLSAGIVGKIENRREKEWTPVDENEEGNISHINSLDEILPLMYKGTWLLLARTNGMLPPFEELCQEAGVFYKYAHKNKDFKDIILAVRDWGVLKRGGIVTASRAKNIYGFITNSEGVKHGSKGKLNKENDREILSMEKLRSDFGLACSSKEWVDALDRITDEDKEYVIKSLQTDNIDKPRVTISTIHGAKGGEADNVVLMSDMGYRAYCSMEDNPDAEHRTWYVGVTRTRNNLFILEPETAYSYEF